ncbi:MAG TPA: hypothetical protein VHO06_15625 [Polyangia bacterium]|nr:hypothetical protein [Polyangia bacterium]
MAAALVGHIDSPGRSPYSQDSERGIEVAQIRHGGDRSGHGVIDPQRLQHLHEQILAGDVIASSELFGLVHRPLAATVKKRMGGQVGWDEAGDLATDAIVEYLKSPGRFDPGRAGLFGYLVLVAHRDALNLVRDRLTERKNLDRFVELRPSDGNDPSGRTRDKIDADRILRDHRADIVKDEGDEEVLKLFLSGESETVVYADCLGIAHLPESEQTDIVKQRRDRIEKRLRRLREDLK